MLQAIATTITDKFDYRKLHGNPYIPIPTGEILYEDAIVEAMENSFWTHFNPTGGEL